MIRALIGLQLPHVGMMSLVTNLIGRLTKLNKRTDWFRTLPFRKQFPTILLLCRH